MLVLNSQAGNSQPGRASPVLQTDCAGANHRGA